MEFYHVVHTKGAGGEPLHGAEVTSAAAQVQEGKARLQVQGLHQLRGDARTGRWVLLCFHAKSLHAFSNFFKAVVCTVNSSESLHHQL